MSRRIWTCAVPLLAAGLCLGGELTLAERGKAATYAVVLPKDASESQCHAAEELCAYVRKMTGVELPVVSATNGLPPKAILLGGAAEEGLGEDGFRLVAEPPHLRIVGSAVRGTLYGVYELLERFGGVRWFASWHEVVPARERFAVPDDLNVRDVPAIPVREVFWCDALRDAAFTAHLRMNRRSWRRTPAKYGGEAFRFGGRLRNCHTFDTLLPPEKHFAAHPEWYSEVGGKRLGVRTQLCLTNPEVLAHVITNVIAEIDRDPTADYFGVSQNDWYNNCTCARCRELDEREGSSAGTMIAFVNAVAEAVAKARPGKKIETLAYQYTRRPPKTLVPRPDVMVCLCSIECDFGHPLATGDYRQNRSFREDLDVWSARTKNLYVWDYTTDFGGYLLPFPNLPVLQENIRFFRDHKVNYLFEQGAYQGWHGEFAELKTWLMAKWMWNPDLDRDRLTDEFLTGFYGAGAPFIRKYIDALNDGWRKNGGKRLSCFTPAGDLAAVLTDDFMARAKELWRAAEEAVKGDAARSYNVRMGMLPLDYVLALRHVRVVNLTRAPLRQSDAARRLLASLDEAKKAGRPVRIREGEKGSQAMLERLRVAAAATELPAADRVVLGEDALRFSGRAQNGRIVDDAAAEGGKALWLANDNYEWYTTYQLNQVAFEPGAEYTLRVRLRAAATGKPGQIMSIGVYDAIRKKGCGALSLTPAALKAGYAWYDVLTWKPQLEQYVYIAPGWFDKRKGETASAAHDGVWIDAIEIVRR